MDSKSEMLVKIEGARNQLKAAKSQRHARDLRKHIYRMERELRHYIQYHKEAAH